MSEQFESWAVCELNKPFEPFTYTPKKSTPNDVDIKILACGICASDIHQIDSGWGPTTYPIVPGHEIIGIVTAIGESVTRFKIGDRVGVGPQVLSCFTCEECKNHDEQYCSKNVYTYNSKYETGERTFGGYAKNIRVNENFVVGIPDGLDTFKAAPLLCAGITTYDPLVRYNVRGKKVAILGVGGLGHLGVKFAVALGNEVVGVSRNPNKREDVLALGANDYIATSDPEQLKKYRAYFDFILCTVNEPVGDDWNNYFNLLKNHGTFCLLGVPNTGLNFPMTTSIFHNKQVTGTLIGSPSRIEEMLKLCVEKNITSDVQVYPIDKINEAIQDFRSGKPRYRFVLDIQQQ